jgi:hypothetical protein
MKTITELKDREWFPITYKTPGKMFRTLLYLIIFTGACLTFSSCAGGYVAMEPSYDEGYERPVSPGIGFIWIEGDWHWNYRTHGYVHDHGYWARSKRGRSYEAGHWGSEPRGKYWVKGRWNRENKESDRSHNRDRR